MSTNKLFSSVVLLLALLVLIAAPACQPASPVLAREPALDEPVVEAIAFDYAQAADISAFRWNAIAQGYEKLGMLNENLDSDDVSAFRWNAIAQGYARLGMLNDRLDPADASAFRWNAIAQGYERLGLLNDDLDPGDVSAFRWLATARGYEKLRLLNTK